MISNSTHLAEINSPNQKIQASVELYRGSTLETTCTCADVLSDFTVERLGEGKFFGFGIVHSLKVSLIDIDRDLTIDEGNTIRVVYIVNDNKVYPYPTFYIKPDGIERDEVTNTLTITAYDSLAKAAEHTFSELNLTPPYTYTQVAMACRGLLGFGTLSTSTADGFNTSFENGANFEGTENIREVLDAIAEATQTVYHIKAYGISGTLRFKKIDKAAAANYTIGKDKYFSLKSNGAAVLGNICHATELGDNVISTSEIEGVTQYVRDNPFWEAIAASEDSDIGAVVEAAATKMSGLSIAQFESEWAGNYLLEPLDKIALEMEDGSKILSFILDDTIRYDGTLSEATRWQYGVDDTETAANPASLGEKLNQTFARVDKVSKRIDIVASDASEASKKVGELQVTTEGITATVSSIEGKTDANASAISALQINTNSISASVTSVSNELNDKVDSLNDEVGAVRTEVSNFKQTSSEALLEFKTTIEEDGVTKVDTGTGFTFNETGLTINKTDSEITTQITEDGMAISKSGEEVLVANNQGVKAEDLHATTFLIIGNNSRFEDWNGRTACFWIGG